MRTTIARCALLFLAVAAVTPCREAGAQIGGLIKRKVGQAAAGEAATAASVGEPVAFNDELLELTPARLERIGAGKAAGRRIAEGPNGPAAIRKRLEEVDARQADLYSKHVDEINAWDGKRMEAERCRDSVLTEITDRKRAQSPMEFMEQNRKIALDFAMAQQRGDSAAMRQLQAEMQKIGKPTKADSVAAERSCGVPAPPGVVKEWMELKDQVEELRGRLDKAEQAVRDAEERESGMNNRQLAISCERIRIYIARMEAKQQQHGFTQEELDALEKARAELKRLCGE
jgi:hypothetical protein